MKSRILTSALAGLAGLLSISTASAQPTEAEAIDATIACRTIADNLERLACLDAAAKTLAVTRIIREEAVAEKEEKFGGESLPEQREKHDEKRPKNITAKIAESK